MNCLYKASPNVGLAGLPSLIFQRREIPVPAQHLPWESTNFREPMCIAMLVSSGTWAKGEGMLTKERETELTSDLIIGVFFFDIANIRVSDTRIAIHYCWLLGVWLCWKSMSFLTAVLKYLLKMECWDGPILKLNLPFFSIKPLLLVLSPHPYHPITGTRSPSPSPAFL